MSRKPKIRQEMQLIMEGNVTISIHSTPLLDSRDSQPHQIVNFLRSGCPSVQWIYEAINPKNRDDELVEIRTFLRAIEIPNEEFIIEEKIVGNFLVITVTLN